MAMPAGDGCKLLLTAIEKIQEKQVWEFYLVVYIHLKEKKSFGQFYSDWKTKLQSPQAQYRSKKLTKEEIIAMAEDIKARHLTQTKGKK